jgi:NADPH:quinone reductase-like Zn-dependent oxidoreductase
MRAVCWEGTEKIHVETVPDPIILNPRDAIIKVTTTAICGSDLHIYDGYIPTMQKGDVLGHEFMGEVVVRTFRDKDDACIKVVMKPGMATPHHTEPRSSRQQ